jgi:predicted nicotinamide N-methyase
MPKFETSDQISKIRSHRGTRVYMGSHPALRAHMRGVNRPKHFGDRVWGSALQLIEQLEHTSVRTVLDIGCGWGLLGIHLARTIGAEVTCTDLDECLENIVQAHAKLNEVSIKFCAVGFDELVKTDLVHDLIVGSDICFSEEVVGQLKVLVDHAFNCGAGEIMIADIGRPDFKDLVKHCEEKYITKLERVEGVEKSKPCLILSIDLRASRARN